MKLKSIALALALLIVLPGMARADEGMWLLSLIGKNYSDMQKQGFKLTPEDIYSVNQSCIKDAIVGLGNEGQPFWHFCTGEIISEEGLMTTNHHCGYGKLQEHSTVEHDYLRDGFWAYNRSQELPNPGLTASILVRMEDVTDQVLAALSDDMSESDRAKAVDRIGKEIAEKAKKEAGPIYDAAVKEMFDGNQYFLFVHIIYKDVRLVGAPPSSMGKFGGDTDNWSWPRHTCDFSMFRIYTAPDGTPAEYAENNIPLQPKHVLPVSIKEIKDGDFAMILGFPGTTDRYSTSYDLGSTMDITNKLRYEIRTVKINVLREEMASSQDIRIKYASKYASCSNYWKYSNEQNKALKNLNTMGVKRDTEKQFTAWAKDKDAKYGKALRYIREGVESRRDADAAMSYLAEGLLTGPEMPFQAYKMGLSIQRAIESGNPDAQEATFEAIRQAAEGFYKDYNEGTEKRLEAAMFEYVFKHMDIAYCPQFLVDADRKYKSNFTAYVNDCFAKSVFANKETFMKFMQKPNLKTLQKDPLYQIGMNSYMQYRTMYAMLPQEKMDNYKRGTRDFVDGLLQINKNVKLMAPNANSTIRLTYGNVKSYDPKDAVSYSYYTTMKGVMEKADPTSSEFAIPDRLAELYNNQDFGQYANSKGELPTCFITNNDITGGNSGSPVLDAEGNLIGLAFDGNGEAMSGDIDFEENLQRCICLDTRYMLWVIDKYAGATNLIREMKIVR